MEKKIDIVDIYEWRLQTCLHKWKKKKNGMAWTKCGKARNAALGRSQNGKTIFDTCIWYQNQQKMSQISDEKRARIYTLESKEKCCMEVIFIDSILKEEQRHLWNGQVLFARKNCSKPFDFLSEPYHSFPLCKWALWSPFFLCNAWWGYCLT